MEGVDLQPAPDEPQLQHALTLLQQKGCTVARSGNLLSIDTPDGGHFQAGDQSSTGGDPTWQTVLAASAHLGLSEAEVRGG